MPQNSNHDFKRKYPNIRAGTLEPMPIIKILTKNQVIFAVCQGCGIRVRHLMI